MSDKFLLTFYQGPIGRETAEIIMTHVPAPLAKRFMFTKGHPCKYLHRLYVAKKLRGNGLASSLLKEALRVADKLRWPLLLRVNAFGRIGLHNGQLAEFYRRHGFKPLAGTQDLMFRAPKKGVA